MGKFYTFNESVIGHIHYLRELPLQDASSSCAGEDGQYSIAVVADGHGDPSCMRSARGSRLAVETAEECLRCFAQDILSGETAEGIPSTRERLSIKKYKDAALRRLTDSIISRWHTAVIQDERERHLSEDDLRKAVQVVHAYGTTLIAALMLPEHLVLIQQGDGQCVVLYGDGTIDHPIPPDARCHENVTTSLCDADAAEGIRSCILDLREKTVAACYLGSDGVEDSFRNMEGLDMFYLGLSCEICDRGTEAFGKYLAEILPQFSAQGSGDDVSVSGIVDLDRIAELTGDYRQQVQLHRLEERLVNCGQRKASMTRKHGILLKRMQMAESDFKSLREQIDRNRADISRMEKEYLEASEKVEEKQADWQVYAKQFEEIKVGVGIPDPYSALQKLKDVIQRCRSIYNDWQEKRDQLEIRLSTQKETAKDLDQKLEEAWQCYQRASDEFTDYDRNYQALIVEEDCIRKEIETVKMEAASACQQPATVEQMDVKWIAEETITTAEVAESIGEAWTDGNLKPVETVQCETGTKLLGGDMVDSDDQTVSDEEI